MVKTTPTKLYIWKSASSSHIRPFNRYTKHASSHTQFSSSAAGGPWTERKVNPWALMSSHWPISSTCCFRTCNHIKGRSLFTDWIIQQRTLLPLYRHCDQLTCTHLLFDFNFGTDVVQYLSDSYYYYFLNPSEVAWFTVPLGICLSEPDITFDNIKNQMITFLDFNDLRGRVFSMNVPTISLTFIHLSQSST